MYFFLFGLIKVDLSYRLMQCELDVIRKKFFFWSGGGLKMMTWQVTSPLVPQLSSVRIRKTPIVVTFSRALIWLKLRPFFRS